jgi:hypothetical protein
MLDAIQRQVEENIYHAQAFKKLRFNRLNSVLTSSKSLILSKKTSFKPLKPLKPLNSVK